MGRPRGEFSAQRIVGDPADRFGFPMLVDAFCNYLAVQGYADETVRVTRCHLAKLARWLGSEGVTHPSDVTGPIMDAYQEYLHDFRKADGSTLTLTSQGACLSAVRRFYEWGVTHERLPANPTLDLHLPPREQRLPKAVLTYGEVEQVVSQPDTTTALGLRDRAILETLRSTGMRRGELMQLRIRDIDHGRRTVTIRQAKGHKDRIVPIGTRALQWIDAYAAQSRPTMKPVDDTLFVNSQDGHALGPHRLSGLVTGYVDRADVDKHGGCHTFRHTLATWMVDAGTDIRHVQAMLGHANLSSTQIYTHVSMNALHTVHEATFAHACLDETHAETP